MQKHLAIAALSLFTIVHFTPSSANAELNSVSTNSFIAESDLHYNFPKAPFLSIPSELHAQLLSKKAASIRFWEAVSWCETHHGWNTNGGYYAGGLGIAQSAWRGYGGWEFARTPVDATKEEQIIVGNRISFMGYQTKNTFRTLDDKINKNPFFRPAVRTPNWGRNCVNWKTRRPLSERYVQTPKKR